MKHASVAVCAIMTLMIGCGHPTKEESLIGVWQRTTVPEGEIPTYAEGYSFQGNGTVLYLMKFQKVGRLIPIGHPGTYVVSNDTLFLSIALSVPDSEITSRLTFDFPSADSLRLGNGVTNDIFRRGGDVQHMNSELSPDAVAPDEA